MKVAADQRDRRQRRPGVERLLDDCRGRGVVMEHGGVVVDGRGLAPVLASSNRHDPPTDGGGPDATLDRDPSSPSSRFSSSVPSASSSMRCPRSSSMSSSMSSRPASTTPRRSPSAAARHRRRVSDSACHITQLAEQVDQLLHVAHEVAPGVVLVENVDEVLTRGPRPRRGREPGLGCARPGIRAARSLAFRESHNDSSRENAARSAGVGRDGGGGGSALRCS